MKIAVLSDIHANHDALVRVLADVDTLCPDRIVCLGDCVGYGPEPEEVIQTLRLRGIPVICGNHEMAVIYPNYLKWFNPNARRSLQMSIIKLSADTIDYIRNLPLHRVVEGCRCVHGFPPDSAIIYLFQKSDEEVVEALSKMDERICFVGHTHDLEFVAWDGRMLQRSHLSLGITQMLPQNRYIINIGSVGQPRDGSPQAKYMVWHVELGQIEIRAVDYDIGAVQRKILAAGLPPEHARRLG